jgi:L-amino acid N-acyltransferase YncA
MKVETNDLIIRNFELSDENDLSEYMLQRVNAESIESMFNKGIHRIYAECAPQNTPSWKLMEKIGIRREAHFRKNVSFHQDTNEKPIYWDTYVYAVLNLYEEVYSD